MSDNPTTSESDRAPPGHRSIAWLILMIVLATSLVVSGSGVIMAALAFSRDLENQQLVQLEDYIDERGRRNAVLFDTIQQVHQTSIERFERRLDAPDNSPEDNQFDDLFPLRSDGTRRSRDALFDGYYDSFGNYHFGVAAYLNPPDGWAPLERRRLVSAYHVVDSAGQALAGLVDNIYFFTFTNELVISAANREDRLIFYRETASAEFDLNAVDFVELVSPDLNPDRRFVCAELTQLISVRTAQSLTTGCFTPYDVDGEPVGAFGTTVQLADYFAAAMADPPPHGENLLIDQFGNLIAHPELIGEVVTEDRVSALYERYDLQAIMSLLASVPETSDFGVLPSFDGRWVIAYSRLRGPGWMTLSLVDRSILRQDIGEQLVITLSIGILGVIFQAILAYFILFRRVAKPLVELTRHFGALRPDPAANNHALVKLLGSQNELGMLARTLEEQRAMNEDALNLLEARVAERTRELETANKAKSTFLATMSHEIRTPLNGILGLARVLRTTSRTKQRQDQARMIQESGETLTQLLNDVLDMSKIEAGKMELAPTETDPSRLLQDLHSLFEEPATEKNLDFQIEIDANLPERLNFDPLRVRQCLTNLLSNAIKFTSTGSVCLSASWREVAGRNGVLVVAVRDTGIGIAADKLDTLFAPFAQSDAAIAGEFGGTGLGLSIARDLAQLMGGDIVARSEPGQGSTFTLTIASERIETAPASAAKRGPKSLADDADFEALQGLRVLLVEDNDINRQVARAYLAPLKVTITEAENGRLALEAMADNQFDIVLMDVRMPIMDGLEATRRLRDSDAAWSEIPVVALTANASEQDADTCLAAGMDAYASKPLHPSSLFGAMRRARELRPYRPD